MLQPTAGSANISAHFPSSLQCNFRYLLLSIILSYSHQFMRIADIFAKEIRYNNSLLQDTIGHFIIYL
jgi:hypothetical protein